MENQDQVKPRRSQRQRKFVDRLQLDGRQRQRKPIDYAKHKRERIQKAAEKRKLDLEEILLLAYSEQKLKKSKLGENRKAKKPSAELKTDNLKTIGKLICHWCKASYDELPSRDFRSAPISLHRSTDFEPCFLRTMHRKG